RSSVRIPELDAVMERAAAASDPEVARQAWAEFTRILQREQPMTFMFWLNELAGVRDELSGVEMDPRGEFQTIRDWTLSRLDPDGHLHPATRARCDPAPARDRHTRVLRAEPRARRSRRGVPEPEHAAGDHRAAPGQPRARSAGACAVREVDGVVL